jgi:hypothetical protein
MPAPSLRDRGALSGVRGLLLDGDGVLPYRLLTNTTTVARSTLAARPRAIGIPVAADRLLPAPVATASEIDEPDSGTASLNDDGTVTYAVASDAGPCAAIGKRGSCPALLARPRRLAPARIDVARTTG